MKRSSAHSSLISAFRHIAHGQSARFSFAARIASFVARSLAMLTVLVFFADTINADILYAAIVGEVQFQDNPLILDSATDSTSVVPQELAPHVNYFALAHYDNGHHKQVSRHSLLHFHGTTILEDVDSPSVLDGETTTTLTFSLHSYDPAPTLQCSVVRTTLDRTTRFGVMLI